MWTNASVQCVSSPIGKACRAEFNKADARAAANEVIRDHKSEDRLQQDEDTEDRFEDTWNHFDVNKDGLVEAERMPQFMRMLLGNALAIDLQ